eukprot:2186515-Amphidinium_carterae.1
MGLQGNGVPTFSICSNPTTPRDGRRVQEEDEWENVCCLCSEIMQPEDTIACARCTHGVTEVASMRVAVKLCVDIAKSFPEIDIATSTSLALQGSLPPNAWTVSIQLKGDVTFWQPYSTSGGVSDIDGQPQSDAAVVFQSTPLVGVLSMLRSSYLVGHNDSEGGNVWSACGRGLTEVLGRQNRDSGSVAARKLSSDSPLALECVVGLKCWRGRKAPDAHKLSMLMARSEASALHSIHVRIPPGCVAETESYLRHQMAWTGTTQFLQEVGSSDLCAATNMTQRVISSKHLTNVITLGSEDHLWIACPPTSQHGNLARKVLVSVQGENLRVNPHALDIFSDEIEALPSLTTSAFEKSGQ